MYMRTYRNIGWGGPQLANANTTQHALYRVCWSMFVCVCDRSSSSICAGALPKSLPPVILGSMATDSLPGKLNHCSVVNFYCDVYILSYNNPMHYSWQDYGNKRGGAALCCYAMRSCSVACYGFYYSRDRRSTLCKITCVLG